jgi:ATP-dependent DNA ligase
MREDGAMSLAVNPPVKPMLAKPVKQIPTGDMTYEPKWDGFRSIIFRDGDEVEIDSRNERPMTRYFPEMVAAVKQQLPDRSVIDGELIVVAESGDRLDFEALQQRIHPAESRVRMLSQATPARFVAFDLLALGDQDYTGSPFAQRRTVLEQALDGVGEPFYLTPATSDPDVAQQWFRQFEGAGLDGVVAKPQQLTYQPDKRVLFKIKHQRTADCVVAGYRTHKSGPDAIGSLLLGLYDYAGQYGEPGTLLSVGVIGAFPAAQRKKLFAELQPWVTSFDDHPWAWAKQLEGHRTPRNSEGSRWTGSKDLSFTPLRPELVVEVRYEHMEGPRFRHTAQFNRWRPDRDPQSCSFDQLEEPVSFDLGEILGGPVDRS